MNFRKNGGGAQRPFGSFRKFIQIREPRRPLPKPVLFAFTVQKNPPALNKYYNCWFVYQMWLCYLTILTSVGSLLEPVKPAKHLTPVHICHTFMYLKPFDLGCDIKNLVTAIKCHHHLEESTVGHARLVGLASPVNLLNPDKAVHGEEHT